MIRPNVATSIFVSLILAPLLGAATCDHRTELQPAGAVVDAVSPDAAPDTADVDPDTADGSGETGPDVDPCDLSGVWALRQVAFNQDTIIGALQIASQWFVVEIDDRGEAIEFLWSIECGVEVSGSARVVLDPAAVPAMMRHNPWDGRPGTFRQVGEGCELEIAPMYSAFGVARADALPADGSVPPIAELAVSHPLPSDDDPSRAQDWDGDGVPGVAYRVSGPVNGKRNEVQRWWYRYFTAPGYEVAPGDTEFVVRAELETETSIIAVEGCNPLCGLLAAGSVVAPGKEHRLYFARLGDDLASADPSLVVPGDDLETCFRMPDFLPHDPQER